MLRVAHVSCLLLLLAAALSLPARAINSAGPSYRSTRSSLDSGGTRKTSPSYRADASVGTITVSTGSSTGYRNRDGWMGVAYQPARITDLWASSGTLPGTIDLAWTAPGNDGDEATRAGSFIVKYTSVSANAPGLSDANFEAAAAALLPPVPGPRGTRHYLTIAGLVNGTTYYFSVKTGERDGVRALLSAGATAYAAGAPLMIRRAQAPFGVALSSAGANAITLRWMPVTRFEDGASFSDPNAPTASELSGYRVYRSSSAILGGWTPLPPLTEPSLSTSTLLWTDLSGAATYYYQVRAENNSHPADFAARSLVRSAGTLSAFVVDPDDRSYFEVRRPSLSPIEGTQNQPLSAYLVEASSRPLDLGARVVKSVEFSAKQGGVTPALNFAVAGLGRLKLRYELAVLAAAASAGAPATPHNLGVYWHNGTNWVQMYGTLDAADQTLNLETTYFGRYQLRLVERAQSFLFDAGGVSNRFATPNGDGKNDGVVFTYDPGPNNASVRVRILDLRGRVVASDLPTGPVSNSRVWDVAGSVPGGVYIYQIEGEGRVASGTIVILK